MLTRLLVGGIFGEAFLFWAVAAVRNSFGP